MGKTRADDARVGTSGRMREQESSGCHDLWGTDRYRPPPHPRPSSGRYSITVGETQPCGKQGLGGAEEDGRYTSSPVKEQAGGVPVPE